MSSESKLESNVISSDATSLTCIAKKYSGYKCSSRAANSFKTCGMLSHRKQEDKIELTAVIHMSVKDNTVLSASSASSVSSISSASCISSSISSASCISSSISSVSFALSVSSVSADIISATCEDVLHSNQSEISAVVKKPLSTTVVSTVIDKPVSTAVVVAEEVRSETNEVEKGVESPISKVLDIGSFSKVIENHRFSVQQNTAADNIRRAYLVRKLRYAMLVAKCQSGKTGAYHSLIQKMLHNGDIQRAYIICGSAETVLRRQAHADAKEHNPAYYKSDNTGAIQIYFHQDFKNTIDITNALVIWDESHLVQTKGQELHKFFLKHGITMDGNSATLKTKNTYMLSVDATPYVELATLTHKETPYEKHIEHLEPGDNYIGLEHYYNKDNMHPTYDITHNVTKFEGLLSEQANKYVLMRLTNGKRATAAEREVRAICGRKGYPVREFTSDKTDIAITREQQIELGGVSVPCLEDAPSVTTVVIIRGRLRAGKVVPKKHIGFVWEGAKQSKTDALVQGLPGRMCGYDFGQPKGTMASDIPLIFVPEIAVKRFDKKVINDSEIVRAMSVYYPIASKYSPITSMPNNATNLKKSVVATAPADDKTQCSPLRLEWDGTQLEDLSGSASRLKDEARQLLRRNIHLVASSDRYTPEQKAEIQAYAISTETPLHGRHYVSTSSAGCISYYKQLLEAYSNGTTPSELITDCPPITSIIAERGFPGLSEPGASHRYVYFIFYTKAKGLENRSDVHLLSRIPKTNGKSIFSVDHSSIDRPIVAGGVVGLDESAIQTPTGFETSMRQYLNLSKESPLVVQHCIQSNNERFTFSKSAFHWTSKHEHDIARICTRLNTEFGIQMSIKYIRSGADKFNIKMIKW